MSVRVLTNSQLYQFNQNFVTLEVYVFGKRARGKGMTTSTTWPSAQLNLDISVGAIMQFMNIYIHTKYEQRNIDVSNHYLTIDR